MGRINITESDFDSVNADVSVAWTSRLVQKGEHVFVTSHEALGVITEEYHELVAAVTGNERYRVEKELFDLAVAINHTLASLGKMEW